jgi:hypothetical protein
MEGPAGNRAIASGLVLMVYSVSIAAVVLKPDKGVTEENSEGVDVRKWISANICPPSLLLQSDIFKIFFMYPTWQPRGVALLFDVLHLSFLAFRFADLLFRDMFVVTKYRIWKRYKRT